MLGIRLGYEAWGMGFWGMGLWGVRLWALGRICTVNYEPIPNT